MPGLQGGPPLHAPAASAATHRSVPAVSSVDVSFSGSGRAGDGTAAEEKPTAAVAAAAAAATATAAGGFQSSQPLDQARASRDTSQAACPGAAAAPGTRTPGYESRYQSGGAASANRHVDATPAFFAFIPGERRIGGAPSGTASPRIARR